MQAGVTDAGAFAVGGERGANRPERGNSAFSCLTASVNGWGQEHGRLLYPQLALLERAGEIEQLFRGDNGAIRVYASSTIGNYILPEIIARYRRDFPNCRWS